MKVYIDLQKLAISKVVDATSPEYQGDINSNVFEILFFNFSGTNWFPTMSQLAPNGREAGDFEADALGQGETHDYTEDGVSYKRYTFTIGDTWVLMNGRSNLYVWYNVLNCAVVKKCVGKLNVMLNESSDNYFISNPVFNPAVKSYIDGLASDIEDELNDKVDAQNATIASLSQASPSVFDTAANIQLLQENKGVAVATDTGYIWYWDTTITPNAYSNSNIQYNSLTNYVKHSGNQLQDANGNNIYPMSDLFINPKDYGAIFSSSVDDTNAVQTALQYGNVKLPYGVTIRLNELTIPDNRVIDFNFANVYSNTNNGYAIKIGDVSEDFYHRNITIKNAIFNNSGIIATHSIFMKIENCMKPIFSSGQRFITLKNCFNVTIDRCFCGYGNTGRISDSNGIDFYAVTSSKEGTNNITNCIISNCLLQNCYYGIRFICENGSFDTNKLLNVGFSNNKFSWFDEVPYNPNKNLFFDTFRSENSEYAIYSKSKLHLSDVHIYNSERGIRCENGRFVFNGTLNFSYTTNGIALTNNGGCDFSNCYPSYTQYCTFSMGYHNRPTDPILQSHSGSSMSNVNLHKFFNIIIAQTGDYDISTLPNGQLGEIITIIKGNEIKKYQFYNNNWCLL